MMILNIFLKYFFFSFSMIRVKFTSSSGPPPAPAEERDTRFETLPCLFPLDFFSFSFFPFPISCLSLIHLLLLRKETQGLKHCHVCPHFTFTFSNPGWFVFILPFLVCHLSTCSLWGRRHKVQNNLILNCPTAIICIWGIKIWRLELWTKNCFNWYFLYPLSGIWGRNCFM